LDSDQWAANKELSLSQVASTAEENEDRSEEARLLEDALKRERDERETVEVVTKS